MTTSTHPLVHVDLPAKPAVQDRSNIQAVITTKRFSLAQDFLTQVWYGILEIKSWHKKYNVYVIELTAVADGHVNYTEFMISWMDVHVKFELRA